MKSNLSNSISLRNKILNDVLHINEDEDPHNDQDICRVCRLKGEETLYHPCLCTGSIKYVHQDCLMQWLKYSKKDVCELCNHKFSFRPLYRNDMPERLPLYDLAKGVIVIIIRFLRLFLTYCIVTTCWLGIVPLMASRIYRMVFSGLISSFFSLKILNLFSIENIAIDTMKGSMIVSFFLCSFISLVWLREQIMIGGAPAFMYLPPKKTQNTQNQQDEYYPIILLPTDPPINGENDNQAVNDVNFINPQPIQDDQNDQRNLNVMQLINNDQNNMNVINDIDRIVDDFTWQRLLGFDGTFAFIEHVFWAISLNIVFNVVFLHWPAQAGLLLFKIMGYSNKIVYFEMPIAILTGYVILFGVSLTVHEIAKIFRLSILYTTSAMIYLMLKVFLLIVVEVALFPIMCGWWLDICSLSLTGATLDTRIKMFHTYPSSSMFLHWLVGMIYVFYSASFILVLRELLRPGVLWFIRNLNDPEFNPVLEMIQQPLTRHFRRLVASTTLFFTIILLVVYIPLQLISLMFAQTLPYAFTATSDIPIGELSLELILLQIVMPTILEYSKAFYVLKKLVRVWCKIVGGWLKLDDFLLPKNRIDEDETHAQNRNFEPHQMAVAHINQNHLENDEISSQNLVVNKIENENKKKNINLIQNNKEVTANFLNNKDFESEKKIFLKDNNYLISNEGKNQEEACELLLANYNRKMQQNDDLLNDASNIPSTSNLLNFNNPKTKIIDCETVDQSAQIKDIEKIEKEPQQQIELQRVPAVAAVHDARPQAFQQQRQENHLAARHQALLMMRDMSDYEEYNRPNMFVARIFVLLVCLAITAVTISFLLFLVPVTTGRFLFLLISFGNGTANNAIQIHDLYTVAAGLYFCWILSKAWIISYVWFQKGRNYVSKVFCSTAWLLCRLIVVAIPLLIIIPFMLGLYFQLLIVGPLRVSVNQTPLFFPWKEWVMGIVYFKIFCASVLMGPDWWLKTVFERIYADGIRNFELKNIYVNLVCPIINFISLQISLPYVSSKIVLFFFDLSHKDKVILTRYTYPCTFIIVGIIVFLFWQWQKLKDIAQKIRNDKYLIGTQLVNFYRDGTAAIEAVVGNSESDNLSL